jgi:hypothetical protein
MNQLAFFDPPLWTVNELTVYLRDLLESDANLQDIWVIFGSREKYPIFPVHLLDTYISP